MALKIDRISAAAVVALTLLIAASPSASACTGGIFKFEDMFTGADVVLRGTVVYIRNASIPFLDAPRLGPTEKIATLHVSEVWKGTAPAVAKLGYTEQTMTCGLTLTEGETLTLFLGQDADGFFYAGWPQIAEHSSFDLDLPFLTDYRQRTEALRAAALNGGETEAIAFAHHLTRWGASTEAILVYRRMIDSYDHDAGASLGLAIAQYALGDDDGAGRSIEAATRIDASLNLEDYDHSGASDLSGLVARAKFVLIGQLSNWRDWANLTPGDGCVMDLRPIHRMDFTRSDLSGCRFENEPIEETVFFGANLTAASFEGSQLEDIDFSGADLTNTRFGGARLNIGDLVGTRDKGAAVNYLKANYDESVLICTLEDANYLNTSFNSGMRRLWLPKLRVEQRALQSIVERWPTAQLTDSCRSLLEVDLTIP